MGLAGLGGSWWCLSQRVRGFADSPKISMCSETSSLWLSSKETQACVTRTAQSDNHSTRGLPSPLCRTTTAGLGSLIRRVLCVFLIVVLLRKDSLFQQSFYSMPSMVTSYFPMPTVMSCQLSFRMFCPHPSWPPVMLMHPPSQVPHFYGHHLSFPGSLAAEPTNMF